MSISSFTTVTMLDSRPSPITISMPKTTDIVNRIITFKDLYGSASNSTITLVTRSGDTFEDGTFSTIISNAYQTINFYAGQPGKWLNIDGGSGGSSAGLTTVSNNLTTVSNSVVTNMGYLTTVSNSGVTNTTNLTTVSNSVVTNMGYLTTVSNSGVTNTTNLTTVSNSVVTNMGYLTTVSNSGVTNTTNLTTVSNTVAAGRFAYVSTNTVSTNLIIAGYVSSPQGYISSLVVDALSFSLSNSYISMGDIITTSVSTIQTFTSTLTTNNLKVGTVSSLSYIAFSGLQQGYTQSVVAEQATASGVQELLIFRGSTNTDRIRMQTTGPIVFEPGVSARVFPATGSNATPAMIITTGSNVGIGVAAPTISLDVAGAGRFTAVSTNTISTNTLNAGYVITSLPSNASFAAASVSPLAVTNGNAYLAFSPQIEFQYYNGGYKHFMGSRHEGNKVSSFGNAIDFWLYSASSGGNAASTTPGTGNVNMMSVTAGGVGISNNSPSLALDVAGAGRFTAVSTTTLSTNQVNSSNICNAGWLSNGGALSNLVGTAFFGALTTTSHSNSGLLCNNGVFSNLVGTAYFAATSNTGILQVGGILTAASNITQNAGTTTLTGLSVNTISTNFISACNISTNSISTNFGFFSTISAGTLYGKYVGDGSLLTNLTVAGVTSILSTQAFYTSSISSSYITSQQGYISSLTVDNLAIGSNYGYVNMGDIVATSLSTIGIQAHTIFTDLITSAGTTLDLSGASINMHTSSIQQYLNFVPCPQPVIQFGSWSGPSAGSEGTWSSSETITITNYNNTNYCIYITGKNNSSLSPSYTAVPINGYSFSVYIGGGHQTNSNVFYWQTMGYYGASAGPVQGSGGGGGGGTGTGTGL